MEYEFELKTCQYCDVAIIKHRKCRSCLILLHEYNKDYQTQGGIQHTLEGTYGRCASCSR